MATALLVVSAIGVGASAIQQRRASREQRRQNVVQNRVAAITRSRRVRQTIAQSRIESARLTSLGFQLGAEGGTAVQGAIGGVASDTASAIQASNLQFTSQQSLVSSQNRVSGLQSTGALFGAVGSVAGGLAQSPQATAALTNLVG